MQIVFVDPPVRIGASQHPWGEIARQLKDRPGEWALCLKEVRVSANQINSGALNAFKPKGAFEARTVTSGKKDEKDRPLFDLYIRYLGEPAAAEETPSKSTKTS